MRQPKSRPLLAFHDRQLTDRREATLLSLYLTLIHFGGIIVPPGYTAPSKFVDGNPYGASLVTTHDNINEFDQVTSDALEHLARRVVTFADRLTS